MSDQQQQGDTNDDPPPAIEEPLYASSVLDDLALPDGQTTIREDTVRGIVSLAASDEQRKLAGERLDAGFSLQLPDTGSTCRNSTGLTALGMQPNQWFLVSDGPWQEPVAELQQHIGNDAWLTDQSDAWATLWLEGQLAQPALERLCLLDLRAEKFTSDRVARTIMEHLSVIIERPADDQYRLHTPRSSARDFVSALITALTSTGNQV